MGIYRIPLSGDAFITQEFLSGNAGKDPILDVGVKYSIIDNSRYIQRILGILDLSSNSDLQNKITDGSIPNPVNDNTVTATLKMFNVLHGQTQAKSFSLDVFPVTSQWDEGSGYGFNEDNQLNITGYANYVSRKAGIDWTTSGGDYLVDSNSATQSFDTGSEHLSVNITNMLKNWLSSVSSNYGFIIKMSDVFESACGSYSASVDLYRKSLFGKETRLTKWPRVELIWDDQIKDYRNFFIIGGSGYLYFYNVINGKYFDLAATANFPGSVTIEGLTSNSSTAWTTVSSSVANLVGTRVKLGIYRALISELPYSLYNTYPIFRDKWTITSAISAISTCATSYFTVLNPFAINSYSDVYYGGYVLNLRNFSTDYQKGAKVIVRLFLKDLSLTYQALTASSSAFTSQVSDNGYWRILTDKKEIDIDWQPLDFDKNGNFLTLDTANLTRDYNYKIDFKLNIKGQTLYFDGDKIPSNFRIT